MATLQDAIDQIQTVNRALAGIRFAPDEPPEKITAFPALITYPETGEWKFGPVGAKTGLHNLVVELHAERGTDLKHAMKVAMPYCEVVPNAILLAFLNGNLPAIQTFENITYSYQPLGWGGKSTVGFKWTIRNVKMQSTIA